MGAIATLIREDCLTPVRSSFAFPLVPPYLSSPRFVKMDRPDGAAGLSRGSFDLAVDSPQSITLCTDPRMSRQEADEALTSSRAIPVSA